MRYADIDVCSSVTIVYAIVYMPRTGTTILDDVANMLDALIVCEECERNRSCV